VFVRGVEVKARHWNISRGRPDDYRIMAVATDAEHLAAAQALIEARKLDLDLRSSGDRLIFVLLNREGERAISAVRYP
jgi:hypothetical protein